MDDVIACPLEIGAGIIACERSRKWHLLHVSGISPPRQGTKAHLLHAWLHTGLWVARVAYVGTSDRVPGSVGETRVLATFILAALNCG